jgi:spermidine synthase
MQKKQQGNSRLVVETWLTDRLHNFYRISLHYQEILLDEQTGHQHIQVANTDFFGKVLLLDGVIQLTEFDNAGYHEMITHIPMLAHDNPRQILIIGGGDGGTLQQVLRYPGVNLVTVCELDVRVIEVCRQYFPDFGHSFDDDRTQLVIQDAFEYLQERNRKFDVIIADTTDPIGQAERLFTIEFYKLMVAALADHGVIVTQCEQLYFDSQFIKHMLGIAKKLAEHAVYYHVLVPTYPGGGIGFLYLSDTPWQNGLSKPYPGKMRYLNHQIHQAAFALPEFLRDILE